MPTDDDEDMGLLLPALAVVFRETASGVGSISSALLSCLGRCTGA
jgi:hypothetical protein